MDKKRVTMKPGRMVDRFVLPRSDFDDTRWRMLSSSSRESKDCTYSEYLKQKEVAKLLCKAYDLEGTEPYPLYNINHTGTIPIKTKKEKFENPWPCTPSTKKFQSSINQIVDIPGYKDSPSPEVLDWSSNGTLVAGLHYGYYEINPNSEIMVPRAPTRYEVFCCKYDPRGEMLALGTELKTVELHESATNKLMVSGRCSCSRFYCNVTSVEWSPTGKSYVMGCTGGLVTSLTNTNTPISCYEGKKSVAQLKISPNARHVAMMTKSRVAVSLLVWPSLELQSTCRRKDWSIKTLSWHPHRSALLAVGATSIEHHALICLIDPTTSTIQRCILTDTHFHLDAMLFSRMTGELVASLWNPATSDTGELPNQTYLVVMKDPNSIVHAWDLNTGLGLLGEQQSYLDRIRHMVFNPDETKLATATVKQEVLIWNARKAEKETNKNKALHQQFSDIPVFLDIESNGFSVR